MTVSTLPITDGGEASPSLLPADPPASPATTEALPNVEHGRSCPKVPHTGAGYLHAEDHDGPYDVDGVLYCGRCHGWIP